MYRASMESQQRLLLANAQADGKYTRLALIYLGCCGNDVFQIEMFYIGYIVLIDVRCTIIITKPKLNKKRYIVVMI